MKTLREFRRLRKIHQLIINQNTGTPKEFAQRLNICESQLYNIIGELRDKGFPIVYDKSNKSYKYAGNCELEIEFSVRLLTDDDEKQIFGGKCEKKRSTLMPLECGTLI